MSSRILVAEDDVRQADLLRLYLEREGHQVAVVHDGRAAIEHVRRTQPDLLILDIMMPKVDGLDVARVLQFEGETPIIFLTARSTEDDLLLGLDLGADDYMTKPFSPREMVARVRTVLRRTGQATQMNGQVAVADIVIDLNRHEVTRGGMPIDCTPKEFAILATLAAEPGRVFTRRQLLEAIFGFEYDGLERTIDVHVRNLRKKLEPDPTEPAYLLTVYGVGYRFAEAE